MKVEKGVTVMMRDGTKISLCVYRPDAPGQFPTLFAASPYQYEMDEVPAYPLFLWRETGPVEWYVSQGYSYVHADVRGSGQSEGEFSFMGLDEQQDYLELIAWIIKQPWCNGRVGGIGQSYYAMAQWLMATYNPPGLACIVPYDGLVDQYRGSNYHGGIYCSYRSVWYTTLRADNQHRPAGKHGRPPMKFDLVGEIINHSLDDDFWRERSPYWRLDKIKCPVLSVGHWGKMGLHLRGNIIGYEELKSPKKLVVTGARNTFEAHKMFDQIEFHEKELLPFYDLHLKGKNNGFMEAEPVKIFVRGANVWRAEEEWPPKRATYVPYYLRKGPSGSVTSMNDGEAFGARSQPRARGLSTSYTYPDWEWVNGVAIIGTGWQGRSVRRVLTFTSAPLEADLEVTGPIVLKLFASSTAIDTQFIVKLTDQQPQDEAARKNRRAAGLRAGVEGLAQGPASREGREALDADPAVLHPHQSAAAQAPATSTQFDIEVLPVSYVFKKGHRHPPGARQRATRPQPTACSRIPTIRPRWAPIHSIMTPGTLPASLLPVVR